MWNSGTAKKLETWYASSQGAFALDQQHNLLQRLSSQWPRRNRTIVNLGCGAGLFLEMLWHYGFDVTGFDTEEQTLELAQERMGHRADFYLGQFDHLPFETDSFDYAALFSVLEHVRDPETTLAEAIRVAKRGVLVGFVSSCSLYRFWGKKAGIPEQGLNPFKVTRMAARIAPGCHIFSRSILPGPPSTWKEARFWGPVNRLLLPFPLGSYVGMCIDTQPRIPLTPLLLKARERALAVCSRLQPEAATRISSQGTPQTCNSREPVRQFRIHPLTSACSKINKR